MGVARAKNIGFRNARIKVSAKYYDEGSILKGDRVAYVKMFAVEVSLDSDEPPERVADLLREADMSCFTLAALRNPTPVATSAVVNGEAFNPADFPALTGSSSP